MRNITHSTAVVQVEHHTPMLLLQDKGMIGACGRAVMRRQRPCDEPSEKKVLAETNTGRDGLACLRDERDQRQGDCRQQSDSPPFRGVLAGPPCLPSPRATALHKHLEGWACGSSCVAVQVTIRWSRVSGCPQIAQAFEESFQCQLLSE